jgi:hypothetical protein
MSVFMQRRNFGNALLGYRPKRQVHRIPIHVLRRGPGLAQPLRIRILGIARAGKGLQLALNAFRQLQREGVPFNWVKSDLWNKNALINFIIPSESIWDFEDKGSKRAHSIKEAFLSLAVPPGIKLLEQGNFPYTYLCTAVVKGKWTKEAVKLCKKEASCRIFPIEKSKASEIGFIVIIILAFRFTYFTTIAASPAISTAFRVVRWIGSHSG